MSRDPAKAARLSSAVADAYLDDQRMAAGIMWLAGDTIFLAAILAIVVGWMRAEARDTGRTDRRFSLRVASVRGPCRASAAGVWASTLE